MTSKRIAVAMSGGVDSSVTAYLLKEAGYDVIGITMDLVEQKQSFIDASEVANKLGISHYVLDCKAEFEQKIISYFVTDYQNGRTPNPCVVCNSKIKFGFLLDKAKELGADYLSTGHYALIYKTNNRYVIKKGIDTTRDQSYFLYLLSQYQLSHTILPLGEYKKKDVRKIAAELEIGVHEKPDSQEICFITKGNYYEFIRNKLNKSLQPGPILDKKGKVLGQHQGIALFTIGQRRGLGIAVGSPLYVIAIESDKNAIIVGQETDLYSNSLVAKDVNWIAIKKLEKEMEIMAKIRSFHPGTKAIISLLDNDKIKVEFVEPQRAITPGQSVVFYKDDVVIGGGVIEKFCDSDSRP